MEKGREERQHGFTLIELSIVLVIIGLIVGGVLVGQDLIRSAGVRAQISQIEKYRTAVATFRGKYGYLPGDLNASTAKQFGLTSRSGNAGDGDGNGVIQGLNGGGANIDGWAAGGEAKLFWVDLAQAGLIPGAFVPCLADIDITESTTPRLGSCLPVAVIGQANYIYVYSGGYSGGNNQIGDGLNYFGLSAVSQIEAIANGGWLLATPGITVLQAYRIDAKIDDGLPQSGHIVALSAGESISWAVGGGWIVSGGGVTFNYAGDYDSATGGPITSQTTSPAYATDAGASVQQLCYDNGHSLSVERYSIQVNGGAGVNCALSFQFQ